MSTTQNSKFEYGILQVNGRYVAEKVEEGKSYVMYFAKTGLTTAGYSMLLKDTDGYDPLVRKGWEYHAHCEWGCFQYTGFNYILYIEKDGQAGRFAMEVGDDMLSDFANFMMEILHKCETLDDVKQLYDEYVKDLESRYETIEGKIYSHPIFYPPHYDKESDCTFTTFFYSPCQASRRIMWCGHNYNNEPKCRARGRWKKCAYEWMFLAEEIEFLEM